MEAAGVGYHAGGTACGSTKVVVRDNLATGAAYGANEGPPSECDVPDTSTSIPEPATRSPRPRSRGNGRSRPGPSPSQGLSRVQAGPSPPLDNAPRLWPGALFLHSGLRPASRDSPPVRQPDAARFSNESSEIIRKPP